MLTLQNLVIPTELDYSQLASSQAKLSIAYGATPKHYLSSEDFTEASPKRTLLLTLERDWPRYLASSDTNIADFLIAETIKAFGQR